MPRRADTLSDYRAKRDFRSTPEPEGKLGRSSGKLFVVQKHDARRLHYDFRLELDGVLKSWAVTKGPSLDPTDKRLAVRTEDHPVDYGGFEGVIPEGYGAGTVMLWDAGEWQPNGDPRDGLEKGVLKFTLDGSRLNGGFTLVRMKPKRREKRENWLLIKERDSFASPDTIATEAWSDSVKTGRDLSAIADTGEDYRKGKQYPAIRSAAKSGRNARPRRGAAPARGSPRFVAPQLAQLRDAPPVGDAWLHELKFDGYRIQASMHGGRVRLFTRNGKDWTDRYPSVANALAGLAVDSALVDGELVAIDERGHSDFGLLQRVGHGARATLRYYAFDLLYLNGKSIRSEALVERKAKLKALLPKSRRVLHYSDHIRGEGDRVIDKACAMNLEGVVSKKASAPYRSGRSTAWIKSKCVGNDEFVIGGYRPSAKRGRPFASLLVGEFVDGRLVYRGRVGAGFSADTLDDLRSRMAPLERDASPFEATPADVRRDAVWVAPELVAQIVYAEKTSTGLLRHPRFLGLREDKPARQATGSDQSKPAGSADLRGVRLTNPDRVMFPGQGATKRAVADYYAANAERLLEHLAGRPVSLVRCPSGRQEKCFFQKHYTKSLPDHLDAVEIAESSGKRAPYLMIRSPEGLIAAAQIGALELHVWGARVDRIERPERVVFDLDPDEGLGFDVVRAAATDLRDTLEAVGLRSFPLLTGGKGVHVIAPLERRREWPDVKAFAKGLARKLADAAPERYVDVASKARRSGRIFIDWLRNQRGATAIAPYALRARPGAPVATPVSWRELARIDRADAYTLTTIGARLAALRSDPWAGYTDLRQSITRRALDAVDA